MLKEVSGITIMKTTREYVIIRLKSRPKECFSLMEDGMTRRVADLHNLHMGCLHRTLRFHSLIPETDFSRYRMTMTIYHFKNFETILHRMVRYIENQPFTHELYKSHTTTITLLLKNRRVFFCLLPACMDPPFAVIYQKVFLWI